MNELTAREKGDIYREKRGLYLASEEVRGRGRANMFHLDTAGFVLEDLKYVSAKPGFAITGNEFDDRPPTSSGQRAFGLSVAEMKKTRDALLHGEKFEPGVFLDPEKVKEVLDRTISSFFLACGMDEDGNEIKDRQSVKAGREAFFENREAFKETVRLEITHRRHELIDAFRAEKGLEERAFEDQVPEEPVFFALTEEHPKEAKEHKEEIEGLRKDCLLACSEAAGRRAAREELFEEIKTACLDEDLDWDYRRALREAFLFYSSETDERIRELLYTKEAAEFQLRWLLLGDHVDEVILEKIKKCFESEPGVLDRKGRLSELPGYVHPVMNVHCPVPGIEELDVLYKRAEEVKDYLERHPEQFEAQSLLSLAGLPNEFFECILKAESLALGVDGITASKGFEALDRNTRVRLFFIWTMADAIWCTGSTMIDFLLEFENKSVGAASDALKDLLLRTCYSKQVRMSKESLIKIMMERSGFHVPDQKDRFLEYFGL